MIERFAIAGYARISVDEELDRDNVSIENQKAIIEDFVKHRFPDSTLTFYEDRDRTPVCVSSPSETTLTSQTTMTG